MRPAKSVSRVKLPRRICSLDLETTKTRFDTPELSTLLFVGTRQYERDGANYSGGRHRVWMPEQLSALEGYLQEFDGTIIGHNILKFDYQVLRPHVRLGAIIEKTVDTLALCWWRRWHVPFDAFPDMARYLSWRVAPELSGLGLDNLSRLNLGCGKTMDPRAIQRVWKADRSRVFKYNAQDCALTKRLWLYLVRRKPLSIRLENKIAFSAAEANIACGLEHWITFADWDAWRRIEVITAQPGEAEWIPARQCPQCGDWRSWIKFDERSSASDWTDGQLAEWYAGCWGTAYCDACGLRMDWEDGAFSFQNREPDGSYRIRCC